MDSNERRSTRRTVLKLGAVGPVGAMLGLSAVSDDAEATGAARSNGVTRGSASATGDGPVEITEPTTIDEPGAYVLGTDIDAEETCLTVQAVDGEVTIEGDGHALRGDGTGRGIDVSGDVFDLTVRNLAITGFDVGLFVGSLTGDLSFESLVIEDNESHGVDGLRTSGTAFNWCTVRENGGVGIGVGERSDLTVRNCDVRDNDGRAIAPSVSTAISVSNCVVVGNGGPVALPPVSGTEISNTEIRDSSGAGLRTGFIDTPLLDESVPVTGCAISGNDGPGILHDSSFLEVRSCDIRDNRHGYLLTGDRRYRAVLEDNNVRDNDEYGALVDRSPDFVSDRVHARCNYWGDPSGPQTERNPRSDPQGDRVGDDVAVVPWSVDEIEGGEGTCIGGKKQVGYLSASSFRKLVGDEPVDCAEGSDGWDGSFHVRREAMSDRDESGVFVDVSPECDADILERSFQAHLITAEGDTECAGGPSGDGPWVQDCCTWAFFEEGRPVGADVEQHVHDHSASVCHEDVQPTNADGVPLGAELDLVRVTFATFPPEE
ncbi:right-handed parallel beta-helix repeat-containing protein [Halorubrum sp. DTA46]|uniref:right-handed parallel beta-helix repeat-containing protein n=1 Tax=Halorubrum sp. DTA46 TaxID=3402162 RepID=UPI003AAAC071